MLDPYSNNTVHVKVSEETYKSEQGIIHQVSMTEYTLISFLIYLIRRHNNSVVNFRNISRLPYRVVFIRWNLMISSLSY